MHTVPLPGIHFFDAWRIRSQLTPDPKLGEKLPSLGTTELIPEEPANEDYGQGDRADIQHRREQERDVKTIAQLALEMSHVHRLADLIKEKADLLKELAMRRKSYQHEVRETAKGKSTAASSAPKKQRTTGAPASVANPVGCSLAVLVVLVFCFGCLVLHCLCPKWLAMAAMWAMPPGSSGNRPSSLC